MSKRIVVIGAGFAGLYSALAARRLINLNSQGAASEAASIEVVVIAPEARLVVRPRLYEADPSSMAVPLDDLFRVTGIQFIKGTVGAIHTMKHEIDLADNTGISSTVSYDRLILAAGSQLAHPNIPGLEEHAFSVDKIEEAAKLEAHLCGLAAYPPSLARNTVLVCGGGFTGIELAAELPARLYAIFGQDAAVRVIIIDREDEIGPDLGPGPRPVIVNALSELGVEMKLGTAVTGVDANGVITDTGECIEALTAVWTAGVSATVLAKQIPGEKDKFGRLCVDRHLRMPSARDIFATGDAACAATDDDGHYTMMSCQHAIPLGRSAGNNAAADLLGLPTNPYSQHGYGNCLDLGPSSAVVTNGWDRKVILAGAQAKSAKQFINTALIYPPKADLTEALVAADPTSQIEIPI
ncbi:hypothetical protein CHGG_10832 [Paecilomyces variotii No. 5]|uniref:FAD/NAD(P)-binding domain-containing protein n=1 Tax=Byssochlamys spectabilis (strain No. 5 / NBRC 109023) TaxID=1356009 RepID=V5I1J5_BYSSN|nr:hypothetical protein CHGG_10832 [Paecilomyces variotii No. 5]